MSLCPPATLARAWTRYSEHEAERSVVVMQWNVLSQALGTSLDNFVSASSSLDWESRRWRVVHEIIRHSPDIICLQEVDHYRLLERILTSLGYQGRFVAKPDSPCLYVEDNNGPDGCALFYRTEKFVCERVESCVLSVWGVDSNQVGLAVSLTHSLTGRRIVCATSHLKARTGNINVMMRAEQGRHLLEWLDLVRQDSPVILAGDFNAEPDEPVLHLVTSSPELPLQSSYDLQQTEFTSCKLRHSGKEVKLLDYILHSPSLETVSTLDIPDMKDLGPLLLPSTVFPSDHLSLAARIRL